MNLDQNKLNKIFDIDEENLDESVETSFDSKEEVSVDISKAYGELTELIKIGKEILQNAKYVIETNPDDSESIHAASNMMNSLKDTIKEFTKLYTGKLNHLHKKEIEQMKIKAKEKLLEKKYKLSQQLLQQKDPTKAIGSEEMVPYCQEKIVEQIIEAEQKK